MLQYLIILLDDAAVSFCHYENSALPARLMPLDMLHRAVRFAMKENLNVQFVYPATPLPEGYSEVIESIDHSKITPAGLSLSGDVVVFNGTKEMAEASIQSGKAYVLRLSKTELFSESEHIVNALHCADRLNIVITDVESFTENDFREYRHLLSTLSKVIETEYVHGRAPQLNLLTDRMMLDAMNNCGAGDTSLTLAPDGRFYVCPAFYAEGEQAAVGTLAEGPQVKNPQLYRLDHAPLCRRCDAWQCRRCVWLNRRTTLEVNTPGKEQCVIAHLERNASRQLLTDIRQHGTFLPEREEISKIDYLDPFEVRQQW